MARGWISEESHGDSSRLGTFEEILWGLQPSLKKVCASLRGGGFLKGFKVFQDVQRGFRGYQGTIIELIEGCGGFKCFKALQGVSVDIRG